MTTFTAPFTPTTAWLRIAATLLLASLLCAPVWAADVSSAALYGSGATAVTGADLLIETSTLPKAARERALSSPKSVQNMALEMYARRVLAAEAVEQKVDQDPEVQQLLNIVRERVLADALSRRTATQALPTEPVLEKLAQQTYKTQPKRFAHDELVQVRHIMIPLDAPNARAEADALRAQALGGADFAALATAHSKDPATANKGGALELQPRGKMLKPFEDAAFALAKPGDISDVVETTVGFHVIQLVEKRAPGTFPFNEVKEQLVDEAGAKIGGNARNNLAHPIVDAAKPNLDAIEAFANAQVAKP